MSLQSSLRTSESRKRYDEIFGKGKIDEKERRGGVRGLPETPGKIK